MQSNCELEVVITLCRFTPHLLTNIKLQHFVTISPGGTAALAPPPFRPGNPALCGSYPLVTPYYCCRLGDLLCFVFIVSLLYFFCCVISVFLQYFNTVGWVFWPVKTVACITYTVLVETLNPAQSINQQ